LFDADGRVANKRAGKFLRGCTDELQAFIVRALTRNKAGFRVPPSAAPE